MLIKTKLISFIVFTFLFLQPTASVFADEPTPENFPPFLIQYICDNTACLGQITAQVTENIVGVLPFIYDFADNKAVVNIAPDINITLTYDSLYRLTEAQAINTGNSSNYTETYTYDPIGNIITKGGPSYNYSGNGGSSYANPHAVTDIDVVNYTYDNAGNLLSDGNITNTWNYRNQLIETDITGGPTITYSYDQDGNRVTYTVNTDTIYYPNNLYNTDGVDATKDIYAGDDLVLTIENTPNSSTRHYVNTDHLLSSNVITDSSGNLEQLLDYYPFGSQRINSGSYSPQKQYVGQEYDTDTGLNYLQARYYDSIRGQFISEDPLFLVLGNEQQTKNITGMKLSDILMDPQSLNSYSYAKNNPITLSDPNGRWTEGQIEGANYLYNNSSMWNFAMDNPWIAGPMVGVGAGATAYGVAAGLTALSTQYLGGALTGCIAFCGKADSIAENGIKITEQGFQHVIDRHTINGNLSDGASLFNRGENISDLIRSASSENPILQKGGNYQRIFDAGRNIGIDKTTNQHTSVMTVITNKANELVTSFPGSPSIKNLMK